MDFNWIFIIPILTFLIFVHELGHFVTARRAGMLVEEFGFGLPPRMFGIKRGETLYSINLIPVGGFVRVLGEDGKNFEERSMQSKTAGQRILFITAGSLMNFLTALVLIAVLLAFQGRPSNNVYVVDVFDDTPAAAAGWQSGDRFVTIAGEEINSYNEVRSLTDDYAGAPMTVVLERNGELIESEVVPRVNPPADQGRVGIRLNDWPIAQVRFVEVPEGSPAAEAGLMAGDIVVESNGVTVTDYASYDLPLRSHPGETLEVVVNRDAELITLTVNVPEVVTESGEPLGSSLIQDVEFNRVPLIRIVPETIKQFFTTIQRMGEGLMMIIRGEVPFSDVAGPIGMGQLTSEIIQRSSLPLWVTLVNLTILLSLNLAILNLLPLPALDGGRLMFVLIEVARRGRRVAPEREGLVHFIGLIILLGFMIVVAVSDIDRIVSGNSLIQ